MKSKRRVPRGVAYDLGARLAERAQLPFEPLVFPSNDKVFEALKAILFQMSDRLPGSRVLGGRAAAERAGVRGLSSTKETP